MDSFGRTAKWIGLAQTARVVLSRDCASEPLEPNDRCVGLAPDPGATAYDERDLAILRLPGKAANSLVCHSLTPALSFEFRNETGADHPNAVFRFTTYVTLESEVLNDPAAVDPVTGVPFGGTMDLVIGRVRDISRSLKAGERHAEQVVYTRACIAGVVWKENMIGFGLTPELADRLFKEPMTLKFHMRGMVRLVSGASLLYGIRLLGD